MNRRLLDPFKSVGLPETIDEFLDCGTARCVAFNRRGTLLAAGTAEGQIVYWDVDTRGVARIDAGHSKAVVSVCWSRDGRYLVSGSLDKTIGLWDVLNGHKVHSFTFEEEVMHVSCNPHSPHQCVVSLKQGLPHLVNLSTQTSTPLPAVLQGIEAKAGSSSGAGGSAAFSAQAVFSKDGRSLYMATSRGQLLLLEAASLHVLDVVKVPGSAKVVGLALNRRGDLLLANCYDKVIRLYSLAPPSPDTPAIPPDQLEQHLPRSNGVKQGSLLGRVVVTPVRELSNAVERVQWRGAGFSHDSEYIAGAAGTRNEHHVYIWNTHHGKLERILEGPKADTVQAVVWHPLRSALYSVTASGKIYIWTKIYEENWSAFAPDFQELEENLEYVEREDEFDLNHIQDRVEETRKKRYNQEDGEVGGEEEEEVDILATEHVTVFSSDDEEEAGRHLHYLPVAIEPEPELELVEQNKQGVAAEEEEEEEDDEPGEPEQLVLNGPRKRKAKWAGDDIWLDPNAINPRRRK